LDPSSHWMVVANQSSDSLVVFAVDQMSGELKQTGAVVTLAKPGGIAFLNAKTR
jgi:6-phosphogluconolactonase